MVLKSRASIVPLIDSLVTVFFSWVVRAEAKPPGVMVTVFGIPNWVTVMVCGTMSVAVMVTTPMRVATEGLDCAERVSVVVPPPVKGLGVSQLWFELAVQVTFEVTVAEAALPAAAGKLKAVAESQNPVISVIFVKSFH